MIFRTITDESTGAIKSIGLFGKSLSDLKTTIASIKSQGLTNFLFNRSTIDRKAVIDYNAEIEKAIANNATMAEKQQIMQSAMKGTNRATAQLIGATNGATISTEALTAAQKQSTLASKAATVGMKALAMAGNMLLMFGISKIISGLYKLSQVSETISESAKELGDSFKNTKSDIESYKSQIEELHKTINNSNSSIEDVTNARKTLMSVQDELIDKFGTEKETIDLITAAINNQSDALDVLTEKQWQETKNEFNDGGFWNNVSNWAQGYDTNIDRMTAEMENTLEILSFSYDDIIGSNQELRKLKQLLEQRGWSYQSTLGGFVKGGNLKEIYSDILEIQTLAEDIGAPDHFLKNLTIAANEAKKTIDSYGEIWDAYILNDRIFANEDLTNIWHEMNEAYSDYQEAFVSGNQDEIDKSLSNYSDLIGKVLNDSDVDESVREYFRSMYPALQAEVEKWEFHTKILPKYDIHGLNGITKADILGMLQTDGMQYGEQTFNSILDLASKYGIITGDNTEKIQQLLDLLVEWGIIQDSINESTGKTSAPTLSISSTIDQINNQLKPSLDALANAYQTVFSFHDETGEKLFSLQDVGIETYASIKSSLDELNKIDGVNIDYSAFERFVSVLSDTSSTADEVQEQFDKLATDIIYTSDCTNMSAETFDLLVKSLSEMGVTNAYEVLEKIRNAQEELAGLSYDVETATIEETKSLIELGRVSPETEEYLRQYLVQKELAQNPLSTIEDVTALEDLCNALGVTGQLYEYVIDLKRAFDAKERGVVSAGLDESIEHIKGKIAELAEGHGDFRFNFSSTDADKPSGSGYAASSAKDTAETFDWIARAIENVEAEIDKLDHIAGSAYSSFSEKNQALADQIDKVKEEIQLQQQAYHNYMDKANSVGLPDAYQQLVQSGAVNIEDITDEALQEAIRNYQKWYEAAQNAQDKINDLYEKSNDLHVSSYENCADELEQLRDSQTISEREYLDRMTALWEFYYKDQTALANQAKEARLELLHEEKDYLQSVADAASDILDRRSDALEDSRDAIIDGYNAQMDALEAQKKPLQDQLDMMEKAEAHEDRILALQKAQAAFRRAESQRDKLKYVNGQMLYTTDEKAVRDAKEALDDAEFEIAKANIQDQIDAYDMQIEKLNELIDATNQYYDNELHRIEQLKNGWQEAQALEQSAIGHVHFESMFGEGSISQLLSGDLSMVNTWKQTYLDTLAGIDMISNGADGDITAKYAELAGLDLTNVTEQTKTVASQFDALNKAVDSVNSAIGAASGGESAEAEKTDTADQQTETPDSLIGAMEASYDTALQVIPAQVEMMNSFTAATQGAVSVVNELIASLERLNAMSMNTPAPVHAESVETAYNGGETEKLLTALNHPPTLTNSLAADKTWQRHIQQQTSPDWYQDRVSSINGKDYYVSEKYVGRISNAASSVTNNTPSYVLNGGVNVTCAGITSQEVAKQVGAEIEKTFFGINSKAYQKANITR